jgi:hypothetical protein
VDARRLLLLGLAAGRVLEAAILRAVGAAEN